MRLIFLLRKVYIENGATFIIATYLPDVVLTKESDKTGFLLVCIPFFKSKHAALYGHSPLLAKLNKIPASQDGRPSVQVFNTFAESLALKCVAP